MAVVATETPSSRGTVSPLFQPETAKHSRQQPTMGHRVIGGRCRQRRGCDHDPAIDVSERVIAGGRTRELAA